MAPHFPLEIVAPHSGASSGVSSTMERDIPRELKSPVGPKIGENNGESAFLSAADLWAGVMAFGGAGSGKTALLEWLWGEFARDRVHGPLGDGYIGPRHSMIFFDTKGDGAVTDEIIAWSEHHSDRVIPVHFADTSSSAISIEMFPRVGPVSVQARRIVNAMVYLWGETSIGPQSFDTLNRVFAAALMITPDIAGQVGSIKQDASPFYYANVLLGNHGDDVGEDLALALGAKAASAESFPEQKDDLLFAYDQLTPVYSPKMTSSQRRALLSAPRTKVAALMEAEHWWNRPNKLTWGQILENHLAVAINVGQAPNGEHPSDPKLTNEMSGLLLYTLREEIKQNCRGWQEDGRAVSIFADEVKAVASTSAEVVTWLRSDGRSFGVRALFATQKPGQLVPAVLEEAMSMGTLFSFTQNDEHTAQLLVKNLSMDGSTWTVADVAGLPSFEAIVRTSVGGRRQTPFTIWIPKFKTLRAAS
ncbi:hypothetical protein [Lysinibacter cavernae]|uniref:hypothetical protein n=1 Tax=Lysinibacter cavernae TaxID=1640652 RepID=UPI0036244BA3